MTSKGLPPKAFVNNPALTRAAGARFFATPAPVIELRLGQPGYWPVFTDRSAEDLNRAEGVTELQAGAMLAGAVFGWDAPAADPDHWANGGSHD